MMFRW